MRIREFVCDYAPGSVSRVRVRLQRHELLQCHVLKDGSGVGMRIHSTDGEREREGEGERMRERMRERERERERESKGV